MRTARARPSPGTCSRSSSPRCRTSRMVFHEITPEAIARAIANPRQVDEGLVDAYQARRVLDRLYGYEVSPVLWKKVMPKLSAGRVQSVATRLVVDRERERIAFRAAAYSDLEAEFATKDHGKPRTPTSPPASPPTWSPWTAAGSPRAATSPPPASCAAPGRPAPGRRGRGRPGRSGWRTRASRSPAWSASPTGARRTRRSAPPRCSRRPRASSASRPSTRCPSRSGCTRTATSPICAPTR